VIETEIGRVGVGICWDNHTARFMRRVGRERMDLLLMPHSGPCITMGPLTLVGERGREALRGAAAFYAAAFGVPTVMANKAAGADSRSPVPWVPLARLRLHFVGQSTICDADGNVCDRLDEREGVVAAEVALDPQRKRRPRLPSGYWSRPPPCFPCSREPPRHSSRRWSGPARPPTPSVDPDERRRGDAAMINRLAFAACQVSSIDPDVCPR
jgi:N-carbamoylputrescine amidase